MIEEYHFGSITIDGKTYNHDIEVWWTGEVLKWWREEGHKVHFKDIKRAIEQNPQVIIIGTGASGLMEVSEEIKNELESMGIELIIDNTEEAVKTFNIICEKSAEEEGKQKKIIGLFHLTC
jgi:hypothetical protein